MIGLIPTRRLAINTKTKRYKLTIVRRLLNPLTGSMLKPLYTFVNLTLEAIMSNSMENSFACQSRKGVNTDRPKDKKVTKR